MKEVKLGEVENNITDGVATSVADQVALGELEMRQEAAKKIIDLFKVANLFVLGFLVLLVIADWVIIYNSKQLDLSVSIIDKQVIMALLGATTIQLGTIMVSIARFLFPSK
jgi:hypothetical protein